MCDTLQDQGGCLGTLSLSCSNPRRHSRDKAALHGASVSAIVEFCRAHWTMADCCGTVLTRLPKHHVPVSQIRPNLLVLDEQSLFTVGTQSFVWISSGKNSMHSFLNMLG